MGAREYIMNNESVPLDINQSKLAQIPSSEHNCAPLNNSNCTFNTSEVEVPHNNISIDSNINVNIPSINNEVPASAHAHIDHALARNNGWLREFIITTDHRSVA